MLLARVSGGSMRPTLKEGRLVAPRPPKNPRVGQVVLIDARGELVIHRLIDRIDAGPRSWIVHLGDASSTPGLASLEQIVGVVEVDRPRRKPCGGARLWALALRLGVLLWRLGIVSRPAFPRR